MPQFAGYSRSRHVVLFVHRTVFSINTHTPLDTHSLSLLDARLSEIGCTPSCFCACLEINFAFLTLPFIVFNWFNSVKDKVVDILYVSYCHHIILEAQKRQYVSVSPLNLSVHSFLVKTCNLQTSNESINYHLKQESLKQELVVLFIKLQSPFLSKRKEAVQPVQQ